MRKTIPLAAACAAVLSAGMAVAVSAPASAAPAEPTATVTKYGRASLRFSASADTVLGQSMTASKSDYVTWSARQGRTLDSKKVETVADPTGSVIASSSVGTVIDGLNVGRYAGGYGQAAAAGLITHEAGTATTTAAGPVIGFAGAPSYSGYQLSNSGGITITTSVNSAINFKYDVQYLRSEFWKYVLPEAGEKPAFTDSQRSGADFWAYARRGIADAKGTGKNLDDLTVRSRPWGGTSGNFKNMIDYAPVGSANTCGSGASIGFSYGGASISIPTSNCSKVKGITSRSSSLEMGADWDGHTSDQQAVEALSTYRVNEGYTPQFADYIWATFSDWAHSGVTADIKWTDTGW
ncbi:hypothetical protein [Actinoplanes sp. URMC 104]|uniref:hypothetical protein n=1 Tax=Actinoplanes sp. URMC 104 TaxID=3423409 RepID=UPI003F19770C